MNKKYIYKFIGLMGTMALGFAPMFGNCETINGAQLQTTINAANASINNIANLRGRFIQTNPDSSTTSGNYWLSRPGKMRFEYQAPNPLLVVSDGTNVIVRDTRLRTTQKYALRSTPLYFLLKPSVNLATEVNVTSAQRENNRVILYLRDRRNEAQGELKLTFNNQMQLLEWSIKDRQNRTTRVQLLDQQTSSAPFARNLFIVPDAPTGNSKTKGGH